MSVRIYKKSDRKRKLSKKNIFVWEIWKKFRAYEPPLFVPFVKVLWCFVAFSSYGFL